MYRRDALFRSLAALCWGGAAVAALVLAAVALESWLWMPTNLRTALLTATTALLGGYVGMRVLPPFLQWTGTWPLPSDETLARSVGTATPAIADRLVTLFQLDEGRSSTAPPAVRSAAVAQLSEALEPHPFDALVQPERVRRAAPWLLVPALVALLAWTVLPNASARLLAPTTSFERPAPYALSVTPGNVERVQGEALTIEAALVDRISATDPASVIVEMETPDGIRTQRMTARSDGPRWTLDLPNVRSGFEYRVRTPSVTSPTYTVDVSTRPLVRGLNVTVDPPSYTREETERLAANSGDVTALRGSQVSVDATLGGGPITEAVLRFDDGRERPMQIDDGTATGTFTVSEAATYHIHLRNTDGVANPDPVRYDVTARADQPPRVSFAAPGATTALKADRVAELALRLRDDFGFARLRVHYRLDRGDTERDDAAPEAPSAYESFEIPLERPLRTEQQVEHTWLLVQDSGLDLLPGDEVVYYAEVWDNDAVSGFKSAETPTQRLRVPTAAERYAELDETQDRAASSLESVREQSQSMQEQFRQLRDEVRRTQEASWEQQSQAQQMRQQQQSMSRQVEEAARQMESATRQMEQQDLNREETRQMYRELQEVIREIDDPEFQDALRELQESMESMDFRQMQQSMEQVEENMQSYQERLERAKELFEKLRAQQKLDEMRDRAEQLRDTQDAIQADTEAAAESDSTSSEDTDPSQSSEESGAESDASEANSSESAQNSEQSAQDLSRQQERARERMEELEQALSEMSDELSDAPGLSQEEMQAMQEQMSESGIQERMQEAAESLQNQDFQSAQSSQQQASDGLSEMASSLSQMSESMSQGQQSVNTQGIWYALENTLWLSDAQERLRSEASRLSSDGEQLRSLSQEQQRLRTGLESVGDSLSAVARNTPQLSRVVRQKLGAGLNAMQTAVNELDARNGRQAHPAQTEAMTRLNELAKLLSDVLDQMQGGGGQGSGMSMGEMQQQMQQMTGDQQALNRALQEHLENVAGERLSVDQQERRSQLRAQQRRLQQQLQSLSQEDAADRMMGDLDRIADEMEQALEEMENPRNERDLLDRQERIVTQMMQAQQALQSQGQSESREGRSAREMEQRRAPGELPPEEATEVLRQGLLDALEGGYSDDYEALIRRYFEALEAQEE
ncbi:hypothetical protein CRI93_08395 [Longimonas halophila]|uniref:DUF4175 domain-containing protein n=2 Tax=Longimonas halophila TaxID=1469170 RepID=A0A2H3NX11_9BACT|nr:hypothetical protein CRI93_08395 [Longimonas halophila]